MSNAVVLRLEGLVGSTAPTVAAEMIRLATLLDVLVELDFNGIPLLATRASTVKSIEDDYWATLRRLDDASSVKLAKSSRMSFLGGVP